MNFNRHIKHQIKSQAGMNLMEVMIAIGIVGALALYSGYYAKIVTTSTQPATENRFNCSNQASTMLAKIRSQTGSALIPTTFYPSTSAVRTPPNAAAGKFEVTSIIPELWPASIPVVLDSPAAPTTVPTAANAVMINGPMRVLNTLYNGSTDFCTTFNTSTELNALTLDSQQVLLKAGVTSLTTKMRLQLYDLATGTVQACGTPYWLHPQGITTDSQNTNGFATGNSPGPYFQKPANYRDDLGILLQVQTSYTEINPTDHNSYNKTCVAAQKLSYDRDFAAPALPTITVSVTDPADGLDANTHTATLTLNETSTEPGLVLVCRDRSTILPHSGSPYACYYSGSAGAGQGPGPQYSAAPIDLRPQANATATETSAVGTLITSPASWVPCENLTLCGKAPDTSPITVGATGIAMTSTYSHLPSDCVVRIEAVAMDTAGNLNGGAPTPFNPAQSVTTTSIANQSTTPRPTCGTFCSDPFGQGYWQEGACCVLVAPDTVGCSPGKVGDKNGPVLPQSTTY